MKNKKGFEFSFAWIFAVIIGACIIFLAIYGVSKLITGERETESAITTKQLTIIFEPMETGLTETKKTAPVEFRDVTRLHNTCLNTGNFGNQIFSTETKSGIGEKWHESQIEIEVPNKYVFSSSLEEGKKFYFFSKPFMLPWKISELIFITANTYCFRNAPEEVEDDVKKFENIHLTNCTSKDIEVCFGSGECDISVSGQCFGIGCESKYDYGTITKNSESMYYVGSLLYGGIFSPVSVYECNVGRLMKRLREQSMLLGEEADFLSVKCGTMPSIGLISLRAAAENLQDSADLKLVKENADEADNQNVYARCKLW